MTTFLRSTALIAAGATLLIAVRWCWVHPYGTSWDESGYFIRVNQDIQAIEGLSRWKALDMLFRYEDRDRPPAYRLVADPLAMLTNAAPAVLRTLSMLGLLLAALLTYAAARRYCGATASGLAALFFAMSIGPLWAAMEFGMEYVLFPAVAGVLLAAFRIIDREQFDSVSWWLLALSLALGALSKASFALIALPVVLVLLGLVIMGRLSLGMIRRAVLPGLVLGVAVISWWGINLPFALGYAKYSSAYLRHHFPWWASLRTDLLGTPFTVLLALALVAGAAIGWRRLRLSARPPGGRALALIVCGCASLPLLIAHAVGLNHNMRLVTPVLLPAALTLAFAFEAASERLGAPVAVIAVALLVAQSVWDIEYIVTQPVPQWNWELLRAACLSRGLAQPRLVHLGNGSAFNPAAIEYPWYRHGTAVQDVWLWRYEDGPIDWPQVQGKLAAADVVLTAPGYRGLVSDKQEIDNQYNAVLVKWLANSALFEGPVVIPMGVERTPLYVYFRAPRAAERAE